MGYCFASVPNRFPERGKDQTEQKRLWARNEMIALIRNLLQRFSLRVQTTLMVLAIGGILSVTLSITVYVVDTARIEEEISRRSELQAELI